ncbi:RNA polymerase sigma factor [Bacteroides rodentium]|uniref:RNA polymerase sigma factor n=1 Tax=Bacteroides rodentium TaxID=691816 RepID=UPI000470DEF3|nr:sigma-70 family RNA polymerase sigma factor [Bacteroides rodentium]
MKPNLNDIVKQYGTLVSSISHRMIQNKEVAKEAVQEAWYEIIKSIESFNGESELSTWIYTICKRTILRYARNERTATMSELRAFRNLSEIEYSNTDKNERDWIKERCDWCLTAQNHCLNNDARMIFTFRITLGLPYKQISKIMEMTEENIRQISSRSVSRITSFMNDTCPLYNPQGTCKCRICKQVTSLDLEKEYTSLQKIIRLVDIYQKLEKELPRKNYWKKFIS